METLTRREAKKRGYAQLTLGYLLPGEQWMLDNVLADMRRGNINCVLVKCGLTVEVWRQRRR